MLTPILVARIASLGIALMIVGSPFALAQVPTRASEPRLIPNAQPTAQVPGQPTVATPAAAPAADPGAAAPAPVSAAPAPSGVTQLGPAAAPPPTSSSSSAATAKGMYSAANFSLNLDGLNAGALHAVEGGAAVAEVVVVKAGQDNIAKKHVAGIKYEELSFDVGLGSTSVIDWIAAAWRGQSSRKNGSVYIADHNYNVVSERQFTNALISSTTVPALEPGKKALLFRVTLAPEQIREGSGSGKVQGSMGKVKQAVASNFRFELGDLETSFVQRIEPFTVGQKVIEDQAGEMRVPTKQAGTVEFSNLKITMSLRSYPGWAKWNDEFLVRGNNGDDQEKNGAIVFLDPTLKNELGRINLSNCGLVRLGGDRQEAMKETLRGFTAELYCEQMELSVKGS